MSDFMDVTCGVTGMAELKDEQVEPVMTKLKEEVEKIIKKGYKYFWLAVVGKASLHYGTAILDAINEQDGVYLELFMPFPNWGSQQATPEQYKQLIEKTDGLEFAHETPVDKPIMVTNNRVLDLATQMIVVSDGEDEEAESIIEIAQSVDVPAVVVKP